MVSIDRPSLAPWSIGCRIRLLFEYGFWNTASIRDYDVERKTTHLWFDTPSHHFEDVDLARLSSWDVDLPPRRQLLFVPHALWVPPEWPLGQRVMVTFDGIVGRGRKYVAFVDGYDSVSRRHHVDYGDTTEWLWATDDRVSDYGQPCDDYIESKLQLFRRNPTELARKPPPFEPELYGLAQCFIAESIEIERRRNKSMNKVTSPGRLLSVGKSMAVLKGRRLKEKPKHKKRERGRVRACRSVKMSNKRRHENALAMVESTHSPEEFTPWVALLHFGIKESIKAEHRTERSVTVAVADVFGVDEREVLQHLSVFGHQENKMSRANDSKKRKSK